MTANDPRIAAAVAAVDCRPVTLQELSDCGLNPFAVKLLAESVTRHPRPRSVCFEFGDWKFFLGVNMIEREKAAVKTDWTGPKVEYWVMESLPLAGDPAASFAEQLEQGLDALGGEGWRLCCRAGGCNQFLVFCREVPACT
jgi:hypothetical protein